MEQNLTSTLTKLRDKAYQDAKEKGFHDREYPDEHWLMLIVCEIAEAVEADRNGRRARMADYGGMPNSVGFRMYVKDTVEDELADVCIRMLDFMGLRGYDPLIHPDMTITGNGGDRPSDGGDGTMAGMAMDLCGYACEANAAGAAQDNTQEIALNCMMVEAFAYCKGHDIDLLRHIKLKMDYNKTRGRLHGKLY